MGEIYDNPKHPPLRIEEVWNLTAANLLILDEHSSLFPTEEARRAQGQAQGQEAWIRMALVKNDKPPPPATTAAIDNDGTMSQPNSTYQALLIERGRLVCETRVCATAHEAAVAMLDYTACQVGEVLSQARKTLRDGRTDTETVFCARQTETGVGCAGGAQTNGYGSVNCSANEGVVGSAESIVVARHKPWGHSPSGRRRGTPDEETYVVRQRDDGKKVNKVGGGCSIRG